MFRTHPKYFNRISKSLLENLAKVEHKIAFKSLCSYIFFSEEDNVRFREIDFLKKYGRLYALLKNLITIETDANIANADQLHLKVTPAKKSIFGHKLALDV